MEASAQPTTEELAKANEVSAAAATAIASAENKDDAREKATAAIRQTADEQKLELSDETINKMVDTLIDRISALGAFDPPPAPAAAAAAPAPEVAAEAAADVAATKPPEKLSWAERHFGNA